MMTWLTPMRMSVRAVGTRTWRSSCQRVEPHICPDSTTSGGTFLRPSSVIRIIGGTAKTIVTIAPDFGPDPDEHDDRDHVREVRQRLRDVQDRREHALGGTAPPRGDAEREAQQHRERHRHDDDRHRLHRPLPLAHQRDPDERAAAEQREPPAAEPPPEAARGDRDGAPRHRPEVRPAAPAVEQVSRHVEQPLDAAGDRARDVDEPEVVLDELEQPVQRVGERHRQHLGQPHQRRGQPGLEQRERDGQRHEREADGVRAVRVQRRRYGAARRDRTARRGVGRPGDGAHAGAGAPEATSGTGAGRAPSSTSSARSRGSRPMQRPSASTTA